MKPKIAYAKPSITSKEVAYATDAAENGWGDRCYEYLNRFESEFKSHLGVNYAIATSSCTGAMHMGLSALGIREGDEVIIADTNWIASVAPVTYLGATPIFVDILQDSWCLDPTLVEAAITSRTKAIIAVHLYGNICDMDALISLSKKHKIPLIEDAAEAIGSEWKGSRVGSIGLFGTFSFHGTKTLTTGEGGMFVTNDKDLYEKVLMLSNHGRSKNQSKQFWADVIGFKYKMSNIQAAIGCAQMERIDELILGKRRIFESYRANLVSMQGISLNPESKGNRNGFWMPTVVFDTYLNITREKLQNAFSLDNIDARVFFYPLSSLSMFRSVTSNKIAWELPSRAINLPSYHDMSADDIDRVIACLKSVYKDAT